MQLKESLRMYGLMGWAIGMLAIGAPLSQAAKISAKNFEDMVSVNTGVRTLQLTADDLQKIKDAGITHVRVDLTWQDVEPAPGGTYNFGFMDTKVAQIQSYGLKIIWVLAFGNTVYENNAGRGLTTTAGRNGYANFAAQAVTHYTDPTMMFEIWNEADSADFWGSAEADRPNEYMALINVAVPAMRAANPNAIILGGASTMLLGWQNSINYLNSVFAQGLLTKVDGLGIHTYSGLSDNANPERLLPEIAALRTMMANVGAPADFPILSTEYGSKYTSFSGTNAEQLNKHARCAARFQLMAAATGLSLANWYQWEQTEDDGYGLMASKDGTTVRPAFDAVKTVVSELKGYSFEQRIAGPTANEYIFVFRNGGQRKIAMWSGPGSSSPSVTLPVSTLGSAGSSAKIVQMLGAISYLPVSGGNLTINSTPDIQYVNLTTNIATSGTISAYSAQSTGTEGSKAIDGIDNDPNNRWGTAGFPNYIEVDLGVDKWVSGTELFGYDNRAYQYKVEVKPVGGSYSQIVDRTANTLPTPLANSFGVKKARWVKLTVTNAYNYTGGYTSILEFKIFGSSIGSNGLSISPEADAFVRADPYANTNYGTDQTLWVKNDTAANTRRSYLRFNLSGITGPINSAVLKLPVSTAGPSMAGTVFEVKLVPTDTWIESGAGSLTWNNRSAGTNILGTLSFSGSEAQIDLTNAINLEKLGDGKFTALIHSLNAGVNNYAVFGSKENTTSALRPTLLINGN